MGKSELQFNDLNALESLARDIGDEALLSKALMLFTSNLYITGKYSEGIEYAQRAFALPGRTSEPEVFFLARITWFLCTLRLGRVEEAMQLALETLELARSSGDRRQLGRVLAQVGLVAFEQKEPAGAGEYFVDALHIAEELKDRKLQTRAFNNLAMFEAGVNYDYARAQKYYRKTIDVAREIGDITTESMAFGNLGFVAGLQGQFAQAKENLERALQSARESGDLYSEIFLSINLSANAGIQNQAALAMQFAEKAISISQKAGEKSGEAWGWLYLGHARLLMDELGQAQICFENSLHIR
jgi:tetratricopeptide (TPR) repeat protein